MDDEPDARVDQPIRIIVSDDNRRTVLVPTMLVTVAVLLALLKPWGASPLGPRSAADGDATAAAPGDGDGPSGNPQATPDPYAELVVTCGSPGGWRAATIQRWSGRQAPIRSWSAVEPVVAERATDPAIPFVPVATDLVAAIGYCAPRRAADTPLDADPQIWRVEDETAARIPGVERLEPRDANPLGGLWLPLADEAVSLDGVPGWRPGRYAIRLAFESGARWLGVEVEDLGRFGGSSPSPGASASAASGPSAPP